jgi:hypothetical protein
MEDSRRDGLNFLRRVHLARAFVEIGFQSLEQLDHQSLERDARTFLNAIFQYRQSRQRGFSRFEDGVTNQVLLLFAAPQDIQSVQQASLQEMEFQGERLFSPLPGQTQDAGRSAPSAALRPLKPATQLLNERFDDAIEQVDVALELTVRPAQPAPRRGNPVRTRHQNIRDSRRLHIGFRVEHGVLHDSGRGFLQQFVCQRRESGFPPDFLEL